MSGNRFSGLINAARRQDQELDVQTSEHLEAKNENELPLKAAETSQSKRQPKKKAKTAKKPTQTSKHSDVQESKHLDISTSDPLKDLIAERGDKNKNPGKLAKSADPNYVRTTLYFPKDLHRKLKIKSLETNQEMSEIVEELVSDWLHKKQ